MADEQYSTRQWASSVNSAITKPRHKLGIDGRLLLFPIIFPCGLAVPFGHDIAHQVAYALIAGVLWFAAKIIWEIDPYLVDNIKAEALSPKWLTDDTQGKR